MFQREQVEKLLHINGLSASSPDDEIKSVLISARWHKTDVDTALLVLRENKVSHETHVDALHKVFHSDSRLQPETISALLGIDMDISSKDIELRRKRAKGQLTTGLLFQMTIISFIFSAAAIICSMWYLQVGIFYPGHF